MLLRVEIVKGTRRYFGMVKGRWFRAYARETPDGVSMIVEDRTWFMAGNRKHMPAFERGQEFNLHKGDPTKSIRIAIRRVGEEQ